MNKWVVAIIWTIEADTVEEAIGIVTSASEAAYLTEISAVRIK